MPKLEPLLREAIEKEAKRLDIPTAALAAVVAVESGGRFSARVAGRDEPLIRFEGHYFDRRLAGRSLTIAREAGLADPRAGQVKNPRGQAARWAILKRAAAIHHVAAHESCSWGCGQVMGSHWRWLGYPSVDALVDDARNGIGGQVRLMGRFIAKSGLDDALRRKDFRAFAKGYNGPAYAKNAYDRKIADAFAAYERAFAGSPGRQTKGQILKRGAQGEPVRKLQADLMTLGYKLGVDGAFGPQTETVLRRFQADVGLAPDGIAGPLTLDNIKTALADRSGGEIAAGQEESKKTNGQSVGWALLTLLYAILQRVLGRVRLD
ncbi:N-acetylmuramidase domain-containing protein [Notoacmeibacter sp. MSK16QG-6]|nr:N-acetylmuramidase domain-containing protein [Notoacmeibacter sp. MSK16QG-6]